MRDLREQFWYDGGSFPSRQRWVITIYSALKNTEGKSTKVLASGGLGVNATSGSG